MMVLLKKIKCKDVFCSSAFTGKEPKNLNVRYTVTCFSSKMAPKLVCHAADVEEECPARAVSSQYIRKVCTGLQSYPAIF